MIIIDGLDKKKISKICLPVDVADSHNIVFNNISSSNIYIYFNDSISN